MVIRSIPAERNSIMKIIISGEIIIPRISVSEQPVRGLFGKKEQKEEKGIRITHENWNQYLTVVQRIYKDTDEDLVTYVRGVNYLLVLKDEFKEKLDSSQNSKIEVNTRYKYILSHAEYRNGKLGVGERLTAEEADQRILDTFHCDTKEEFASFLEAQEAETQKEEVVLDNRDLRNGGAIGWFGLQRYKDKEGLSPADDETVFGYWRAAEFAITKLEGVLYLKD